ncbi:MAG TPA: 6-phosphofructokinase, partial [Planctomycetes bacterium]|nr:6-phosphofructokinase [Planctomycetota bacterium]
VDAAEAREVGRAAVRAAIGDEYASGSIAIRRIEGETYASDTFVTPLDTVAKYTKDMPDEFLLGDQGVTSAFRDYAMPLTGGIESMVDLSLNEI